MSPAGILISIPILAAIVWMIWYYVDGNRKLNSRLIEGDLALLDSSQYNVSEVLRAPAGSRIDELQSPVMANSGGFIKQQLPDGRVVLIPMSMVSQIPRPVLETTHNIPQHREQKIEPEQ